MVDSVDRRTLAVDSVDRRTLAVDSVDGQAVTGVASCYIGRLGRGDGRCVCAAVSAGRSPTASIDPAFLTALLRTAGG